MRITLSATHSRLAEPTDVDLLGLKSPAGVRLSRHQVETYRALTKSQPGEIVFNTALTGDGKSLAGMLPSLRESGFPKTLAMYPTKELIKDQEQHLLGVKKKWDRDLYVQPLDADLLSELQARHDLARGVALSNEFRNKDIVLTNPDIFHYVMQACYTRGGPKGDAPDKIIGPMLEQFRQFTFDEFHIFQAPQIVSVVNALWFIREVMGRRGPRILFLSATPGELLLKYLNRAQMPHRVVQGEYAHGKDSLDKNDWRLILRCATLNFYPDSRVEDWADAHLDDTLLKFFLENKPNAKGAIIVNSIASAMRLGEKLRPIFAKHGLTVLTNTGLNTRNERKESYEADLLIGTSTVDVGVDFRINFLIFESRDAGTFLQRLGRLGRHDGYARGDATHPFEKFEAHALVPKWVHEQLFVGVNGEPPRLRDDMEIDRSAFAALLPEAFPPMATFEAYGRRWGGYQAARIYHNLRNPTIRDSYAQTAERLKERYEKGLNVSINFCMGKLNEWQKNARELRDEVLSFRGQSPFKCGVIDKNATGADRIKFYDLFSLIANFNVQGMTMAKFNAEARTLGWTDEALDRLDMVGAFCISGTRRERADFEISLGFDPEDMGEDWFHHARVINRVTLIAPGVNDLNQVNAKLRANNFVALISPLPAAQLTTRLRLPMPFPIYPAIWKGGRGGGSIAFARYALLLDTVLATRQDLTNKAKGVTSAVIT